MKKRILAFFLSGILACSALLSGCGESNEEVTDTADVAMGRYLEEEISLPADIAELKNMTILEDGTLRIASTSAGGKLSVWDYRDGEWKEDTQVLQNYPQIQYNDQNKWIDSVALDQTGRVACSVLNMAEDGTSSSSGFYVMEPDGEMKDFSESRDDSTDYPQILDMQFTGDGDLIALYLAGSLKQYDGTSGEEVHDYGLDNIVTFSVVGEQLYVIAERQLQIFQWKDQTPVERDEVLSQQIEGEPSNLTTTTTSSVPVTFAPQDEEGSIFYCTSEGIYSHQPGGTVNEQVVDGNLCSISSTAVGLRRLMKGNGNDFYLLAMEDGDKIFHYTYSEDTPSTPGTTLKLYSLVEDQQVRQLIPMFQKMYPDIYVDYQVGISGEDGVTVSDALKNLNTELMAGNGPDVLLLDNMPVDSYIDKGMLADISDVIQSVDESDGILENVKNSYERDGKFYAMPSYIGIPILVGTEENLDGITDLKSMADKAEQLKEQDPQNNVFDTYTMGSQMIESWSNTCSPAWITEDGTVDREALTEFYTQLNRIYHVDENALEGQYSDEQMSETEWLNHYFLDISSDLLMVSNGYAKIAYGSVFSYSTLEMLCGALENENLTFRSWNGQTENTYVPSLILGVSSKSQQQEAAKQLVSYFLSEEAQSIDSYAGFPVNASVVDSETYWSQNAEGRTSGMTMETANGELVDVFLESRTPTKEQAEAFRTLLKAADTPVAYNYQITSVVRSEGVSYINGEETLEQAVENVGKRMDLYLAEQAQ